MNLQRAEVAAIIVWRSDDGDVAYSHLNRRPEWEMILPELMFAEVAWMLGVIR